MNLSDNDYKVYVAEFCEEKIDDVDVSSLKRLAKRLTRLHDAFGKAVKKKREMEREKERVRVKAVKKTVQKKKK